MTLSLTIGGVERAGMLSVGSLSIPDEIQSRGTAKFRIEDETGAYLPREGQQVVIVYNGVTVFGGTIEDVDTEIRIGTTSRVTDVTCVDFNQLADRHLVARSYTNQTAGAIVRDIVAKDLAGEGVSVVGPTLFSSGSEVGTGLVESAVVGSFTLGGVMDGPIVKAATFSYQSVTTALNELAELVGFYWNIDASKLLTFAPREQVRAPFQIGEVELTVVDNGVDQRRFRDMKVKRSRSSYRNKQYVRAGVELTDPRTESFKGDGVQKTFGLAFPVASVPTNVTVNGVAKTIGIKGVETGKDWYWNKGETDIVQDDAGVALTTADTLAVTYQGSFPIVIASLSQGEIDARATLEGGTGVYEHVEEDASLDSVELAQAKAAALIRRYGKIPEQVTFETDDPGLQAGQLLRINSGTYGINADYLIQSVETSDVGMVGMFVRTRVTAISGERLDNWVDFFRKIIESTKQFVIRENEQLSAGRTMADTVGVSEVLTLLQGASDAAIIDGAVVGFAEVGDIGVTITGDIVEVGVVDIAVVGRG